MFYRPTISSDPPSTKDVGVDNKTTLSELTPYTMYEVTVQAFTGAGGGDTSVVKVMTDETGKPQGRGVLVLDSLGNAWRYFVCLKWEASENG